MCFRFIASRRFRCAARGWFCEVFSSDGYRFDPGIIGADPKRNERFVAVGCLSGVLCSRLNREYWLKLNPHP